MTTEGVDFAFPGPNPGGLYRAGKRFVGRYLGAGSKAITQAEYDRLTNAGLEVFFYWEDGAGAALKGRARGVSDAQRAQARLAALRGPSNQRPIYFAVDTDTSADSVRAYFEGVKSVLGKARSGAYGSYRVVTALRAWGLVAFTCQTAAWSGGQWDSKANLRQYRIDTASGPVLLAGGHVDYVRAYTSNYGQRAVLLSKPAPKPAPAPEPAPTERRYYVVQPGDTLGALAAKYGHSVSTLQGWNGIADPNVIRVGQRLRVG